MSRMKVDVDPSPADMSCMLDKAEDTATKDSGAGQFIMGKVRRKCCSLTGCLSKAVGGDWQEQQVGQDAALSLTLSETSLDQFE